MADVTLTVVLNDAKQTRLAEAIRIKNPDATGAEIQAIAEEEMERALRDRVRREFETEKLTQHDTEHRGTMESWDTDWPE